ncbi:MAG: helix-turn-helix domain-containing protein [Gammaproteobacteria bacterium]
MMVSQPIPAIRTVYLNRVLEVINTAAVDVEKSLQRCRLPTNTAEYPDAYVPISSLLSFMRGVTYCRGVEDVGLRAASRLTLTDFNHELQSAVLHCSELETALWAFCTLAEHEQSTMRYRVVRMAGSAKVRICCSSDNLQPVAIDRDMEWFSIMSMVTVIRHFKGESWMPATIALQSQDSAGRYARSLFPDTLFNSGQQETSIEFPAALLLASTEDRLRHAGEQPGATSDRHDHVSYDHVSWDFPTSLQKLLRTYLDDGYPDISLAAEIAGSSVRTLQRRLSQYNLRYSELVHQLQIECAKELLADNDLRTLDVAYAVGYQDSSNFARAFRRIIGLSPQQYRSQMYAH